MRKYLTILAATVALTWGQTGPTLPLSAPTPPGVTGGLAAVIGGLGSTPYYYWIVARYPGGNSAPSGPIAVLNGPASLTAGNFIRITWDAAAGATAYDVLRTSTRNAPVGPCGCLEAGAVAGTSVTDTGSTLGAYTVATAGAAAADVWLDNVSVTPPVLKQTINGVSSVIGSGGGGGVSSVAGGASGSIVCTGTANVLCDVDPAYAATLSGTNNFTGIQNAANATATSPMKVAMADPATCTVGEFVYRQDLQQTKFCGATNTWTQLGGGGSSSLLNRTTAFLDEEFCNLPANGDRNFTLGWQAIQNGGVQDGGANEVDVNHPCVAAIYSNSAANSVTGFTLQWNGADNASTHGVLGGFTTNTPSEYMWTIKTTDVTQVIYRVGLMNANSATLPNDGLFFQFSNNSGCTLTGSDTAWQVFSRASSTSTPVTSGVAVSANTWYTFRLRSTVAGTWLFSVSTNGGAFSTEVSRTTDIPTTRLSPAMFVVGCTGGLRYMHLDRFAAQITGLVR